jgi:hypothetical protein
MGKQRRGARGGGGDEGAAAAAPAAATSLLDLDDELLLLVGAPRRAPLRALTVACSPGRCRRAQPRASRRGAWARRALRAAPAAAQPLLASPPPQVMERTEWPARPALAQASRRLRRLAESDHWVHEVGGAGGGHGMAGGPARRGGTLAPPPARGLRPRSPQPITPPEPPPQVDGEGVTLIAAVERARPGGVQGVCCLLLPAAGAAPRRQAVAAQRGGRRRPRPQRGSGASRCSLSLPVPPSPNAPPPADTLRLTSPFYQEAVIIEKPLRLVGAAPAPGGCAGGSTTLFQQRPPVVLAQAR